MRPSAARSRRPRSDGLAATAGIEDGPIEDDQGRFAVVDRDDARLDRPGVGVRVAELLAGRGHAGRLRVTPRSGSRSSSGGSSRRRCRRRHRAPARRRPRVSTPLKTSPLNTLGPVGSPWWMTMSCGVPGSLLSNVDLERVAGRGGDRRLLELDAQGADRTTFRTPVSVGGSDAVGAGRRRRRTAPAGRSSPAWPRARRAGRATEIATAGRTAIEGARDASVAGLLERRSGGPGAGRANLPRARPRAACPVREGAVGSGVVRGTQGVSLPVPSGRLCVRRGSGLVSRSTSRKWWFGELISQSEPHHMIKELVAPHLADRRHRRPACRDRADPRRRLEVALVDTRTDFARPVRSPSGRRHRDPDRDPETSLRVSRRPGALRAATAQPRFR